MDYVWIQIRPSACIFVVVYLFLDRSFCTSIKFLGVIFSDSCRWDEHIEYICKSASRRVYALRRLKAAGFCKADLIRVFGAFIRSIVEYNSPLFVGLNVKNNIRIEKLQRLCHRIICGNECSGMCLGELKARRLRRACRVFSDMLHRDSILHHLVPRRLHYSGHLESCLSQSQRRSRTFIPFCTTFHNSFLWWFAICSL